MSRDLTSGMATEVDAGTWRPVLFYEGVFSGGTLRLWSGVGSIAWNAQTWVGAGSLLSVSPAVETADLRAQGMTLSLSGLSSDILSKAETQAQLGFAGSVWLGAIDSAGAIVADPYMAFKGKLDQPSTEENGATCTISVSYENELVALSRPKVRRWTHDDAQIDTPGEAGFQYVDSLVNQVLEW